MKKKIFNIGLTTLVFVLVSCSDKYLRITKKYEKCIDYSVLSKRESWGFFLEQGTKDTFLNFENYLLIKGHIKAKTKEEYRKLVDDVVASPEKYVDIFNHMNYHDQYVDQRIIFNPDLVLLYCPSNILEKENNDVLSKQLEIMQHVLDTSYGDGKSVNQLFEITPSENFEYLGYRIPAIYMIILKVTQFHLPKPGSATN